MVHMAHASRFHWDNVGDDQNRAIGEWQVARVYAVLGRAESALFHIADPEDWKIVAGDIGTLPIT
jgi:hypothetical protein